MASSSNRVQTASEPRRLDESPTIEEPIVGGELGEQPLKYIVQLLPEFDIKDTERAVSDVAREEDSEFPPRVSTFSAQSATSTNKGVYHISDGETIDFSGEHPIVLPDWTRHQEQRDPNELLRESATREDLDNYASAADASIADILKTTGEFNVVRLSGVEANELEENLVLIERGMREEAKQIKALRIRIEQELLEPARNAFNSTHPADRLDRPNLVALSDFENAVEELLRREDTFIAIGQYLKENPFVLDGRFSEELIDRVDDMNNVVIESLLEHFNDAVRFQDRIDQLLYEWREVSDIENPNRTESDFVRYLREVDKRKPQIDLEPEIQIIEELENLFSRQGTPVFGRTPIRKHEQNKKDKQDALRKFVGSVSPKKFDTDQEKGDQGRRKGVEAGRPASPNKPKNRLIDRIKNAIQNEHKLSAKSTAVEEQPLPHPSRLVKIGQYITRSPRKVMAMGVASAVLVGGVGVSVFGRSQSLSSKDNSSVAERDTASSTPQSTHTSTISSTTSSTTASLPIPNPLPVAQAQPATIVFVDSDNPNLSRNAPSAKSSAKSKKSVTARRHINNINKTEVPQPVPQVPLDTITVPVMSEPVISTPQPSIQQNSTTDNTTSSVPIGAPSTTQPPTETTQTTAKPAGSIDDESTKSTVPFEATPIQNMEEPSETTHREVDDLPDPINGEVVQHDGDSQTSDTKNVDVEQGQRKTIEVVLAEKPSESIAFIR